MERPVRGRIHARRGFLARYKHGQMLCRLAAVDFEFDRGVVISCMGYPPPEHIFIERGLGDLFLQSSLLFNFIPFVSDISTVKNF